MIAPENSTGAFVYGKEYRVKKGKIDALVEHVKELAVHGFSISETQEDFQEEKQQEKQTENLSEAELDKLTAPKGK